jgi:ABC transporter
MLGEVAIVGVVDNEDGPHKVVADLFQALNDIGYTIPAQGSTYWKRRGDAEQGLQRPRRGARSGGIRDRLDLQPGTVTALAGENGAGKSTLMKIVSGQYSADHGTVTVQGHWPRGTPATRSSTASPLCPRSSRRSRIEKRSKRRRCDSAHNESRNMRARWISVVSAGNNDDSLQDMLSYRVFRRDVTLRTYKGILVPDGTSRS